MYPTLSFCTPCLKWKFILASKAQFGFNGFVAPFHNKYLRADIVNRRDFYSVDGNLLNSQTAAGAWNIDRLTGEETFSDGAFIPVLFPQPIAIGLTHPDWALSDVFARSVTGAPGPNAVVTTLEWTLSDAYTPAQVEADLDAQIAAVNPDTLEWFKLYDDVSPPLDQPAGGDWLSALGPRIPSPALYTPNGSPWSVPALKAAAWQIFEPSPAPYVTPTAGGGLLGYLMKLVGFFAMQGRYCERTYYVDAQQTPVGTPGCVSGRGGCGTSFRIEPPPLVAGENAYKIIAPNCRCEGGQP